MRTTNAAINFQKWSNLVSVQISPIIYSSIRFSLLERIFWSGISQPTQILSKIRSISHSARVNPSTSSCWTAKVRKRRLGPDLSQLGSSLYLQLRPENNCQSIDMMKRRVLRRKRFIWKKILILFWANGNNLLIIKLKIGIGCQRSLVTMAAKYLKRSQYQWLNSTMWISQPSGLKDEQ